MKIDSSTISMNSGRVHTQGTEVTHATKMTEQGTGNTKMSTYSFQMSFTELSGTATTSSNQQYDTFLSSGARENENMLSDLYNNFGQNSISTVQTTLEEFHNKLIKEIEAFMERIRNQLLGRGSSWYENSSIVDVTSNSNQPGSFWTKQTCDTTTTFESETTTFSANGIVQTADGRSIDFQISMEMSRSFMQTSSCLSESTEYILTDPLVIQLNDAPDTIDKQTFSFDIDGDGEMEDIHKLTANAGFLALDLNENGIIDDGTELFGTKSGNGFSDLAAYDEDGNGWIDENDSVFTKLKIWTKDSQGNDTLMNLAQADVGAIYLGYADTQFQHKGLESNELYAQVRQTGVFLHESTGTAGTIQQIDFATKDTTNVA